MERAGSAVADAALAVLADGGRPAGGVVLVLAGPGNNGGDGFVAARHLATAGRRVAVAFVSSGRRPGTPEAAANWDALAGVPGLERLHCTTAHDVNVLLNGLERAALVIDALLGTGVQGRLREPISTAVELCLAARRAGVPILSVDTPTAVDLTSGAPSDPVVRADVTVTFHRPKTGLLTRAGARQAGRVMVAPIGIPPAADPL
jgi:hydroxyethylthiazole kinase-like uncharacterized protein yjeF